MDSEVEFKNSFDAISQHVEDNWCKSEPKVEFRVCASQRDEWDRAGMRVLYLPYSII